MWSPMTRSEAEQQRKLFQQIRQAALKEKLQALIRDGLSRTTALETFKEMRDEEQKPCAEG